MVVPMDRSAPERHDIIHELIDRAELLRYRVRDDLKIDRELREQIVWCHLLSECRKILQVGEKHRHEPLFDPERERSSSLDQLSHHIQRHERGERTQRGLKQRNGGLQFLDLPNVGRRPRRVRECKLLD